MIEVTIDNDLKVRLYDTDAKKVVKSLPKRGSDPKKYEEARAKLAQLKKDIRSTVRQRRDLLLEDFLSGRSRGAKGWGDAYLVNPVLNRVARLIVWDQDGATFTVCDDGIVDASGNEATLSRGDIKVAHPVEMTSADVNAWRAYFAQRGIKQPFEQVWERVATTDKVSVNPERYKGCLIPAYLFKGREKHGIYLNMGGYNDTCFEVSIDGFDLDVKQHDYKWKSIQNRLEIAKIEPRRLTSLRRLNHIVVYLDRCCFYPRLASGDMTVMNELDGTSLADIIDYARVAAENDATELVAALLTYREEHFPEYGGVESLLLD